MFEASVALLSENSTVQADEINAIDAVRRTEISFAVLAAFIIYLQILPEKVFETHNEILFAAIVNVNIPVIRGMHQ